jgi:hypothetical protein
LKATSATNGWDCGTDTTYTAGTGISLTGTTFSNKLTGSDGKISQKLVQGNSWQCYGTNEVGPATVVRFIPFATSFDNIPVVTVSTGDPNPLRVNASVNSVYTNGFWANFTANVVWGEQWGSCLSYIAIDVNKVF